MSTSRLFMETQGRLRPVFGAFSNVQMLATSDPQVRTNSRKPTQCLSGARYPVPPRQPQPLHEGRTGHSVEPATSAYAEQVKRTTAATRHANSKRDPVRPGHLPRIAENALQHLVPYPDIQPLGGPGGDL